MMRCFRNSHRAIGVLLTAALTTLPASWVRSQELPELLLVGAPIVKAKLEGVGADGTLRLRDDAGALIETTAEQLVRWSTPAPLRSSDALLLADGSLVALAPAWSSRPTFNFDGREGEARTRRFGRLSIEPSNVTALLLKLPRDQQQVADAVDKARKLRGRSAADQLLLDNGDVVSGKVLRIVGSEDDGNEVAFQADFGPIELPLERIRVVVFSADEISARTSASPQASLMVGLDDGSLIAATGLVADEDRPLIQNSMLGALKAGGIGNVVFLQSLGGRTLYLSDLEPASYDHEPYLELPWQYRRDRNVLGQHLRASDQPFLKGLGMHSTSRLIYDVPDGYQTFAAAVAIDDAAEAGGSVVFQVRLAAKGQWREAWSSTVIRGGEAPHPVRVELDGADQIELVVEHADCGDERDYANWLDARLEKEM